MVDIRSFFLQKMLLGIIYLVRLGNRSVYVGQELQTDIRYYKDFNKFNTYEKLLNQRMKSHRTAAARNTKGGCRAFCSAIRKYGFDSFTFTIIHQFNAPTERELRVKANILERHEISKHKTFGKGGYNLTTGGQSDFSVSQETRGILSAKGKARKGKYTATARANMSKALMGHSVSEQTKALISQRLREGFTDERRIQISERNTKTTEEQRTEIIQRYQTGNICASELANEYNVSVTTITNIIKTAGVDFVRGQGGQYAAGDKHPQSKITAQVAMKIYKMQGLKSGRQVALEFGVSPQCVSKIWKKQKWASIHTQV